jgi:hypothetical protein
MAKYTVEQKLEIPDAEKLLNWEKVSKLNRENYPKPLPEGIYPKKLL